MLCSQAFSDWMKYRGKLRKLGLVAASTITNQSLIVLRLREQLGAIELEQLRKSDIELYIGARRQTCAPVTVWGEVNVLAQILKWCEDEGHLANKPRIPTVSVPKREEPLPSDEAFEWMLAHLPPCHRRAFLLMMLTGLSPHETARLEVRDGVASPGAIIPYDIKTGPQAAMRAAINTLQIGLRNDFAVKRESRRREVPLNEAARIVWFEATAGMMPNTRPFPSVEAMQTAMRREIDALTEGAALAKSELFGHAPPPPGIARLTPKMGRQWFASRMAADNVPENVLQRLLGHTPGSPVTRKHYVRSSDDQLVQAVEGLRA
jgi:integrase